MSEPLKNHCKKTTRAPTLKFSPIVKNNEDFAWEKFKKFLKWRTDQGQCHHVIIAHNFVCAEYEHF